MRPRDRRTGIVVVLEDAFPALADARRRFGPETAARGLPLHVTLLFPWVPVSQLDASLDGLRELLARQRPFELELVGVAEWPGIVYAEPAPCPPLTLLMRTVWDAYPDRPPYGTSGLEPSPHATLAAPSGAEQPRVVASLREALAPVFPVRTTVDAAMLIAEQAHDEWALGERLPLGGAS